MELSAVRSSEACGSIVALEGRTKWISTQLQLLPHSPQILILPGLSAYMRSESLPSPFSPKLYLVQLQDAIRKRNEAAKAFLAGASHTNKRLVFTEGAAPTAQAMCLKAFLKYETEGNIDDAEAILDTLFDGYRDRSSSLKKADTKMLRKLRTTRLESKDEPRDPILKAMLAADALDRETADLQPSTELDLTMPHRSRSVSLPIFGFSDSGDESTETPTQELPPPPPPQASKTAGKAKPQSKSKQPPPPTFGVINYDGPQSKKSSSQADELHTDLLSPGCVGDMTNSLQLSQSDLDSPMSDIFRTVEYGQASVLNLRESRMPDPVICSESSNNHICTHASAKEKQKSSNHHATLSDTKAASEEDLTRPKSCMLVLDTFDPRSSRLQSIDKPRTVTVKATQPVVKIKPVPIEKKRRLRKQKSSIGEMKKSEKLSNNTKSSAEHRFPCAANLVLYLKDDNTDAVLEAALRGLREIKLDSGPPTAKTIASEPRTRSPVPSEEYDPFAYTRIMAQSEDKQSSSLTSSVSVIRPPTPAQTPPPIVSTSNNRLHELVIKQGQTPVCVQNTIRSVLRTYFPPQSQGYRQFQFNLLPELDEVWQPIFGDNDEATSTYKGNLKQILAISCEQGVKKDQSSRILHQLEQWGSKQSQTGRCARLDFRYLLANTMQAFTAQPLTSQAFDNPFRNPYLLATLIMAQLETYLAVHTDIRCLLLEHGAQHLPTVDALQRLAGIELVKVVRIVDAALDGAPSTSQAGRGSPVGWREENKPVASKRASLASCMDTCISKTNYLISSNASERNVISFAASTIMLDSSTEGSNTPPPVSKNKSDRSRRQQQPRGASAQYGSSPATSQTHRHVMRLPSGIVGLTSFYPISPTIANAPPSPSPSLPGSVETSRRSTRSRRKGLHRRSATDDGVSLCTLDLDDEDSDYDMEERRLMPLYAHKRSANPVDTRKALKFLGLE